MEIVKFGMHNNIKESNNTKESESVPKNKFALIDLQKLWFACKKALDSESSKKQKAKEQEQNELFEFKQLLIANNAKAYDDYIAYRSEKKKLSKHTLKRIQNRFLQLQRDGQDLSEVVENSIMKGWTDLYPVQTKKQANHEQKVKQSKEYKSFTERYKDFDYEKELAKIMAL